MIKQYCRRCGGFITWTDTERFDVHKHVEVCVGTLSEIVEDLESRIVSIESKLEME